MAEATNHLRTHRHAVSYIDKSREYYAAHGYGQPYKWASYDDVPFAPWAERDIDLSEARVSFVTTAFPSAESLPKKVYAQDTVDTPTSMFTRDLSWHKEATHTDDVGTFLPLDVLKTMVSEGMIGSVGPRFFGVPTDYSQRRTDGDADQILAWALEDELDAVVLVPL